MLWWLAQNTLIAAALAGSLAVVCHLGRFRPALRHALWLVVLIKLLTPPLVEWPWALPELVSASRSEPAPAAEIPDMPLQLSATRNEGSAIPTVNEPVAVETFVVPYSSKAIREEPASPLRQPSQAATWQPASLASLAVHFWLASVAAMGILQLIRIVRFRRLLFRSQPAPQWLIRQIAELSARLRVREPVTRIVPRIGSPLVAGLGRPKLLWPSSLLERLPPACHRSVIAHELAHLRRRDHWVGWLLLLAECLWWWNPLFWYVRRQLRLNAELACDAWVVWLLPGDRRAYAEALIEVTQIVSQTAGPALALGMSSGGRQAFERRLTMIMRERVPCRVPLLSLGVIGLLALVALPGWSQVTAPKPKPQETKKDAAPAPATGKADVMLDLSGDLQVLTGLDVDLVGAQPNAEADRDRRLQELEKKLQALLKEVQALRGGNKPAADVRHQAIKSLGEFHMVLPGTLAEVKDIHQGDQVLSLTRATYKLSNDQAAFLAAFLKEHMKAKVMETKVEGGSLTVTTTPETQKAISGLIALIQGKPTAAKEPKPAKIQEVPIKFDFVEPIHVDFVRDAVIQKFQEKPKKKDQPGK